MSLALLTNAARIRSSYRDERSLAKAIKTGDRDAFDQLTAHYRNDIARFLALRLPSSEVEDVLQETMLAAWQSRQKFDFSSAYRTWLIGIAINKSRDRNRSNSRENGHTSIEFASELSVKGEQSAAETQLVLRTAIAELDEASQEIIHLYYGGGLKLREIASVTGTNLNTLKYRFYGAHRQLLERLGKADLESLYND